jgi:hypothetical protein
MDPKHIISSTRICEREKPRATTPTIPRAPSFAGLDWKKEHAFSASLSEQQRGRQLQLVLTSTLSDKYHPRRTAGGRDIWSFTFLRHPIRAGAFSRTGIAYQTSCCHNGLGLRCRARTHQPGSAQRYQDKTTQVRMEARQHKASPQARSLARHHKSQTQLPPGEDHQ